MFRRGGKPADALLTCLPAKQHFTAWWRHRGFVIATWGAPLPEGQAHEATVLPDQPWSIRAAHCDGPLWARLNYYKISRQFFPVDALR